jgi:hypothetical protein
LPDSLGFSNNVLYSEVEKKYLDNQIIFRSIKIKISIEKPAYKPETILKHTITLNAVISIHTCKIDGHM